MNDTGFGMSLMTVVRAVIGTILATTLAIGIVIAELDETRYAIADPTNLSAETLDLLAQEAGPLNFDSTFLLLTTAIVILVVPDAIAYFRRRRDPDGGKP